MFSITGPIVQNQSTNILEPFIRALQRKKMQRRFYLIHQIQKKRPLEKHHQQNKNRLSLLLMPMLTAPIMQKPVFMAMEVFCVLEIRKSSFREAVMSLKWPQCIMLPERFWDAKQRCLKPVAVE